VFARLQKHMCDTLLTSCFHSQWNSTSFDIPFILDRLKIHKIKAFLGRGSSPSYYRSGQFSSKAYGRHDRKEPAVSGRILFDMLPIVRRGHKLRSYKLNAVAEHFLGDRKVVRQK